MVSRSDQFQTDHSQINYAPSFMNPQDDHRTFEPDDDDIVQSIFAAVHDKSKWFDVLEGIVKKHRLMSAYLLHRNRHSKEIIVEVEFPKPVRNSKIPAKHKEYRNWLKDELVKQQHNHFEIVINKFKYPLSGKEDDFQGNDPNRAERYVAGCYLSCPVNELYVWVESDETKAQLGESELNALSGYIPLFRGSLKQLAKTQMDQWKIECLNHVIDDHGAAIFLVDGSGKVQHTNKLARDYVEAGLIYSGETMVFKNQNDSERYGAGLKTLFENDLFERSWQDSFLVQDDEGQKYTVKISPYFCDGNLKSSLTLRSHMVTVKPLTTKL